MTCKEWILEHADKFTTREDMRNECCRVFDSSTFRNNFKVVYDNQYDVISHLTDLSEYEVRRNNSTDGTGTIEGTITHTIINYAKDTDVYDELRDMVTEQCGCKTKHFSNAYYRVLEKRPEVLQHIEDKRHVEGLAKSKVRFQSINTTERRLWRNNVKVENTMQELNDKMLEVLDNHKFTTLHKAVSKNVDKSATGVIHISDTHFNELINIASNQYDFQVASQRLQKLAHEAIEYFQFKNISKVLIAFTGDLVNSDRRVDEVLCDATNRTRASWMAVNILQQFIKNIAEFFDVKVAGVCGNESRVKDELTWCDIGVTDNYDATIYYMLNILFQNVENVEFIIGNPLELVVNVSGQNLLMMHGHSFRASEKPENAVKSAVQKYSYDDVNIDFTIVGHIHSAIIGDTYARSSSLCGNNNYANNALQLSGRASQNLYVFYNNGNRDGYKVDLQNVEECFTGYEIGDAELIAGGNIRSVDKTKKKNVMVHSI